MRTTYLMLPHPHTATTTASLGLCSSKKMTASFLPASVECWQSQEGSPGGLYAEVTYYSQCYDTVKDRLAECCSGDKMKTVDYPIVSANHILGSSGQFHEFLGCQSAQ